MCVWEGGRDLALTLQNQGVFCSTMDALDVHVFHHRFKLQQVVRLSVSELSKSVESTRKQLFLCFLVCVVFGVWFGVGVCLFFGSLERPGVFQEGETKQPKGEERRWERRGRKMGWGESVFLGCCFFCIPRFPPPHFISRFHLPKINRSLLFKMLKQEHALYPDSNKTNFFWLSSTDVIILNMAFSCDSIISLLCGRFAIFLPSTFEAEIKINFGSFCPAVGRSLIQIG